MKRAAAVLAVVVLGGCAGEGAQSAAGGELVLDESSGRVSGHFLDHSQAELGRIDFTSRFVDTNVLDIELRFHGMTITSTVDFDSGVIEHDGFATDSGADTQMLDDDRALVLALTHALDARGLHVSEPVERLRAFTSTWAEFPSTVDLQGVAQMPQDRSYTSICWAMNSYQSATHDCWSYDDWEDSSTLDYAWVSMSASGSCNDGTYFWNNGSWQCYEPDHSSSIEYGYGNCFGRCGSGCGSSTQMTWDCLDHDQCVRTGHDVASFWCDDEFTSTTDDWAAAPNC